MNISTEVIHIIEKDGTEFIRLDSDRWYVFKNGNYFKFTDTTESLEDEFSQQV